MGFSECRICGEGNGASDLTDGVYLWPSGLSHYLQSHEVRLPDQFISHAQAQPSRTATSISDLCNAEWDGAWWRTAAQELAGWLGTENEGDRRGVGGVTILHTIHDYLESNNVVYRRLQHPPVASAQEYHETLKTPYEQQAKALFIRYRQSGERGFVVLGIQAQKKADLSRVKDLIKARDVRLGTVQQLKDATGCAYGELPPLGKLFGLQLLYDNDLLSQDEIYFNAGSLTNSIAIDPAVICKIEDPIIY